MEIEFTHTIKHGGRIYSKGDIVDSKDGAYFCACGWARDVSGKLPTSAVSKDPVVLEVKSATHNASSKVI